MSSSAVAFFCEDIRTEQNGQHTLVGLLPDNIAVPRVPGAMPKLAVFVKVHVDTGDELPELSVSLRDTNGELIHIPNWDAATVAKAKSDAVETKSPIYGLILMAMFAPFKVTQFGTASVSATINGESRIIGILNFIPDASASQQPASQSPPVSPET